MADINFDSADWQALDAASIASIGECRSLSDTLTKQMADIESQLAMADARRELGEQVDPMWYAKAKAALKYRGRVHQMISRRLGDLTRAARQSVGLQRWEYKESYGGGVGFDLEQLGKDGWALVSVVHHYSAQQPTFYFKRQISAEDPKD